MYTLHLYILFVNLMVPYKKIKENVKKNMHFSIMDGVFWVLMNTIAITFLAPYIIELGANPLQVGLLSSLPIFISAFTVLLSYKILKYFRSKKAPVILSVTIQAALWIPIALTHVLFKENLAIWFAIIIYILIYTCGIIIYPIYTDWFRRLLPISIMGNFFARKHIIIETISIFVILGIGYFLDFINSNETLIGFSIIFLFAGVARFISSRYLNKIDVTEDRESILRETSEVRTSILKRFNNDVINNRIFLNYLIFIVLFYFGFYIGTVYWPYFLLKVLNYSYSGYIWWKVALVSGTILSLSYWGYISDNYGVIKIIKTTSFFMPLLVIIPAIFYYSNFIIIFMSFLSGVVLGGFNLAINNYLYKNIKKDVIHYTSYFIIIQSTAILLGTLFGALVIKLAQNHFNNDLYALLAVFIVSGIFRFIAYLYSNNLKDKDKGLLNLYRSIVLQKPVYFGLKKITYFVSGKVKILTPKFKENSIKITEFRKNKTKELFNSIKKEKTSLLNLKSKITREEKRMIAKFNKNKKDRL